MLAFTMPCSSEQIVIDGVDMVGMQTSHWYWEPRIVYNKELVIFLNSNLKSIVTAGSVPILILLQNNL